jgi:hypothetical protein
MSLVTRAPNTSNPKEVRLAFQQIFDRLGLLEADVSYILNNCCDPVTIEPAAMVGATGISMVGAGGETMVGYVDVS